MFIQIAPRVNVYVSEDDVKFIQHIHKSHLEQANYQLKMLTEPRSYLTKQSLLERNLTPTCNML